jgi:prepilin-type N-terminal cleavage/methylation domain-containing protein
MTPKRALRGTRRGYTIVELVMSLAVLAIGATGVIAMQKVAIASNRHAKDLATASRVAQAWADQLAIDAAAWSIDSAGASTIAATTWLKLADPSQTVEWFVPDYDANRDFGPGFSIQGTPINTTIAPQLIRFCTHLRFAYLHSATTPFAGHGVIRAQIRVFWPAEDAAVAVPAAAARNACAIDAPALISNIGAFHVIYLTTSVAQSPVGLL